MSNRDWIWLVRPTEIPFTEQSRKAYELIVGNFIPEMQYVQKIPCEFIYCKVAETSNFTIERKYIDPVWMEIFKDAGFTEKPIPSKDQQASDALREALLSGSNFSKHWN